MPVWKVKGYEMGKIPGQGKMMMNHTIFVRDSLVSNSNLEDIYINYKGLAKDDMLAHQKVGKN